MTSPQVLESGCRLSESLLWRLQRRYFETRGRSAWAEVPHYITSNPYIADCYARMALGWLRDLDQGGPAFPAALDPAEPIYILELGCGPGRFGFLFLKRFLAALGQTSLHRLNFVYVFSDFAASQLDKLKSHPQLQPLIEQGRVDFAKLDAAVDAEIRLELSGRTLAAGDLRNPLLVIANYVFDSLPQDLFACEDGRLCEKLVTLTSTGPQPDREDPALLGQLAETYESRPAAQGYYREATLDRLLQGLGARAQNGDFLFPLCALSCLLRLAKLAEGRLLLLCGDRGFTSESALLGWTGTGIGRHGSISMTVDFDAIGRFFRDQGGEMLCSSHLSTDLQVAAGILGAPRLEQTRLAFESAVERQGPADYFVLRQNLDAKSLNDQAILAWLRISGWDPLVFLSCSERLVELVQTSSALLREDLRRAIPRIWETHFSIGEREDLAFQLGTVLSAMGCYGEALFYFEESVISHGSDPATLYNLALCMLQIGQPEVAAEIAEALLAEFPDHEAVSALCIAARERPV